MPWQPLTRIAFAVATYPFSTQSDNELPLEIGDDLYIIEQSQDGQWLRGYLLAPPSLLAGLTTAKGQALEARVFSGIFPRSCVEIREVLGEGDDTSTDDNGSYLGSDETPNVGSDSGKSGVASIEKKRTKHNKTNGLRLESSASIRTDDQNGLPVAPFKREPGKPKPPAPVPMLKVGDETPTSASEPLIDEIASCLREWHSRNLHELLLAREYSTLEKLSQLIHGLDFSRRQFLHNVLTTHEYSDLREKTVWDLVKGNKLCGGEVIVRDPAQGGRVLTGDDSVVEITRLQSLMSLLDEPPKPHVELTALHHLLVDVKTFSGSASEATTLAVYLVSKPLGGFPTALSESYIVDVPPGGTMSQMAKSSQMRTLFTDLTSTDIGDASSADTELYLVIKVRAAHQIAVGKPMSRSGTAPLAMTGYNNNQKPPSTSATKSSRRSLMWGSTRSAFSRGGPRLDALSEQPEEQRPATASADSSLDGGRAPSSSGSRPPRSSSDASQTTHLTADRLVGMGVLKLNQIMKNTEESEHLISVWAPSTNLTPEKVDHDEGWDELIIHLLDSKSGQFEKSRRAERLQIHLRPFDNPDADALVKATPTQLSGVTKTSKLGFAGAPTKPRSDIYVTINQAFLSRQNLISRFGGSATSIPSHMTGVNLMVTMEVRRKSGERIENCIFASSNGEPVTTWKSYAVERGEAWNQTLRLALQPQDVSIAHLVMTITDLPNVPFAVAYIPLWEQQAFIKDGPHSLLLYKLDENTQTAQPGVSGRGGYLSLPWSTRGEASDVTGPLAALRLETYLCSTRFSQDRVVLGLLRWKEQPKEDIPGLLKQLIFVPEIEVVKLLSDVLDALFGTLVEYQGQDEFEDLVFTALVRVLGIVHDRRFNLGPLVDQYAESRFNYPFATPCLVRSFTRLLSNPTDPETARKLRATLKVVRHILKFITHGRGQQKAKEAGIGITSTNPGFTRHLQTIFKALDSMMRSTAPVLVGSQTLAVQHFHSWLPELTGLLTTEEILHIAIDFMDSCSNVKGKLVLYKLILIINYSKLDLFSHPDQRAALSANTVRWISPHWGQADEVNDQWKEQVRLCCSVLASQIDYLGTEIPDYIPKILDSYIAIQQTELKPKSRLSLLFPSSYPFPSKPITEKVSFDEALIELSAVLSAISNSPSGMQLELADDDLGLLIEKSLHVHMSILQGEAFPATWLSIHIFHHKSTMKILQYLSGILLESFLPHPDEAEGFSTELWKMFFTTLLKLVGSGCLALEIFPEQKRRAVWKIAGDVRVDGADLLRRTWEAIGWEATADERSKYGLVRMGGYQVQYVPGLVGPIVELCLSVHEGLRKMAVEVLHTMIVSEWTLSEDLSAIQTELIDHLDLYFKDKQMTESILQKLFIGELLQRFQPLLETENELYTALLEMIGTVEEFLDLLVAVHSGEATGAASQLINRLRLMEFLRDMQKEEIFIRYVHQLATLQADARNHAEAGLALRLHADLYDWNPIKMAPALHDPELPAQTHFERKERIYFDMIKHFEDGDAWSSALAAYKELQDQYENNIYDFAKLARAQRSIATIYESLAKSDRVIPKYFKVVFKGLGFPPTMRAKEYIYEGWAAERTSAFTDRMQEQFQSAQILTTGDVDNDAEGQYLVISAVSPYRDLNNHVFQRARVPQAIRDYLLSAHPQTFSVSSKRSTSGPVTEHYAEKAVYTTAEPFPTILRRSEIVEIQDIRLTAKETALERIVRKTQEMTAVEKRLASEDDNELARLLVDAIAISTNPTSDNSVVRYRELLPKPEPDEEEDEVELDAQETAIKMALIDHAIMIKRCLASFSRSSNRILAKGYEDLHTPFELTFSPEIEILSPPRPAREANSSATSPIWQRSSPTTEHSPGGQAFAAGLNTNIATVEEASAVQPISVKQRGTRLSFLGGKRKSSVREMNSDRPISSGDTESDGMSSSRGKEGVNRMSFFRAPTNDGATGNSVNNSPQGEVATADWSQSHDRKSSDVVDVYDHNDEKPFGGPKLGSVRKRLSMLRLGGKWPHKAHGPMGGVDEE
ncbi:hypothetical protein PG996_004039 [Apiospora saccharicola]|uniref:SH3 domain-containing protein n=1 Tax=Apiospora saccharicola TaxID=335842 RepID=A0ABR1W6Q3_9PEZI